MTKADFVEKLVGLGYLKKDAFRILEQVFETIKNTLEVGEDIKIIGFGVFKVKKKADRKGRNPQTGEQIIVSGRTVLSFKPSPILKNYINS